MMVEVSVGEVIDKYTILVIKSEKIKNDDKLVNITKEKNILSLSLSDNNYFTLFKNEIKELKIRKIKMTSSENKFQKLIDNKESFQIQGDAGYGKSYLVNGFILPYLKEKELKYYCTSSTKENSEDNKTKSG